MPSTSLASRRSSAWYLVLFVVSATGVIWQMVLFLQGVGVVTATGQAHPLTTGLR